MERMIARLNRCFTLPIDFFAFSRGGWIAPPHPIQIVIAPAIVEAREPDFACCCQNGCVLPIAQGICAGAMASVAD